MERKTKEIILVGMIIFAIIALSTIVKAESTNTFKASATANTTTLKPGEEITITIGVSDINMGANGINTLEGTIKYDKTIFEEIKSSSIQSLNGWTTTYNDENSTLNGKFLAVNLSTGTKENTQVFSVKFKVKADIDETKETQIDFENITSNDGTDLISVGTKSVKLTINVEKTNPIIPEETDKKENNTSNENKIETNKNTTISDKTQASTKLPNTGKSIAIIFILVVAVIAVIGLGAKNRSMKDIK